MRRQYRAGDVICREGEFGNTAYILEKGEVEIYLNAPIKHAKTDKVGHKERAGLFGMFFKFATGLVSQGDDPEDMRDGLATGTSKRYIPVDAPVTLDIKQGRPAATLTPDDLIFGEMSCMNNYPRSATVRAKTDVTVLEILRNVLYILHATRSPRHCSTTSTAGGPSRATSAAWICSLVCSNTRPASRSSSTIFGRT